MHEIYPKLITDAGQQPIAVQIDYADWLEIERLLALQPRTNGRGDLSKFEGTLKWNDDGLKYQRGVREERAR